MAIDVKPFSAPLGAEITGVDRSNLEVESEALFQALLEHHVLLFRGDVMSDDDFVRLAEVFGPVRMARTRRAYATRPEVMIVSNIRENGETIGALPDGEVEWHYDGLHQKIPYALMMLHAVEVPRNGGETRFADMCLAYEALSPQMKERIADLTAINSYGAPGYGTASATDKQITPDSPTAVHPVVREVPETGRKAIFVCQLMTDRIVGLSEDESRDILAELYRHLAKPEFAYEHSWQVGDVVLWDNRCVMHARNDFGPEERRLLKRLTIAEVGVPSIR